jgi:hypothetical protein
MLQIGEVDNTYDLYFTIFIYRNIFLSFLKKFEERQQNKAIFEA